MPFLKSVSIPETSLIMASPRNTNAKVVFLYGTRRQLISETFNKSWAFCKWYVAQHKSDKKYIGGVLKVVSVYGKVDE